MTQVFPGLHTNHMCYMYIYAVIFDSDSHFSLSHLKLIDDMSLREIEAYKRPLQSVMGMDEVDLPIDNLFSLLEMWVQGRASLRPTWRHFLWALREIKLNHLADQMEAFLSGVAVEQVATSNLGISPKSEETKGRKEDNKQEQGEIKYCIAENFAWCKILWFLLEYLAWRSIPSALAQ